MWKTHQTGQHSAFELRDKLERGGFKKITVNATLFQVSGTYRKLSLAGTLQLTLLPLLKASS